MTVPEGALNDQFVASHLAPLFSLVLSQHTGIYLANHSLGRPPDATQANVNLFVEQWGRHLDECWKDDMWMGEVNKFRQQVASLVGLQDHHNVVPKSSAGQGLRAVLNSFPVESTIDVVTTTGEFDSVEFILKTYESKGRASVNWVEPTVHEGPVPLFDVQEILAAMSESTDIVVVSAVYFMTGQVLDGLADIVKKAHACQALVVVDAYHAIGVLPFDMTALDADFVIGGCYKYLRGGPGACYLAIHPRNVEMRTLDTGWFAKKDAFAYRRPALPEFAEGGDAWLESTPPVITAFQANPGLEVTRMVGVDRIREHNLGMQETLRGELTSLGVEAFRPKDAAKFGAFSLVPQHHAPVFAERIREAGVTVDARGGFLRFGPDFLNTSEDLGQAAQRVRSVWS